MNFPFNILKGKIEGKVLFFAFLDTFEEHRFSIIERYFALPPHLFNILWISIFCTRNLSHFRTACIPAESIWCADVSWHCDSDSGFLTPNLLVHGNPRNLYSKTANNTCLPSSKYENLPGASFQFQTRLGYNLYVASSL